MCDPATIISAGVQLIASSSNDGSLSGAQASSGAAGAGALKALGLTEDAYNADAPLRDTLRSAAIRSVGEHEAAYNMYQPVRQQSVDEAMTAGNETMQNEKAAAAEADVNASAEANEQTNTRRLSSLGLAKPGDAAYGGAQAGFDLGKTTAVAAAGTQAREREFNRGVAQRQSVAGQQPAFNPGYTPTNANSVASAASTLSSVANSQAGVATDVYNLDMAERSAVGSTIGGVLEKAVTPPVSSDILPGGMGAAPYKDGGPVKARKLSYVGGGAVTGPGGPKDDAVPAVIDGTTPAALSNEEFVIKAESTKKYGHRLMQEVNDGTAIIVPTRSPRRLKSVSGEKNAKAA